MNNTQPTALPAEAQALLTAKGFDELFWQNLRTAKTQHEAYTACEQVYSSYFGRNKYSSFDSYRKARDRRYKK